MPEVFIKSFTHLKDRSKADQALPLLQRVASLVKPIMRKHGWTLPVLAEFFPESPNLMGLNINGGQKILLRLRPAHAPDIFYDEEGIVHTMLHELTHNVHGPHNDDFYKFLSGLEDEYDALKRSGYAGEGFFSKGQRLGTDVSHNLPPHIARQRALEAAEKRRRINILMSGGGRLGGSTGRRGKSPRELAAEAAERRARDEKACASGAVAVREAEKAAKESVEDKVIDITHDSDSEPEVVLLGSSSSGTGTPGITMRRTHSRSADSSASATPRWPTRPPYRSRSGKPSSKTPPPSPSASLVVERAPPISSPAIPPPTEEGWACPRCTLVNDALNFQCAACMLVRPPAESHSAPDGWTCQICGEVDNPHQFWSCRFCGSVKRESVLG